MTRRRIREAVTFVHPFQLPGMEGERSAGTYTVEIDEQLIDGFSSLAYRRAATWILLPRQLLSPVSAEVVGIDPAELQAALERDHDFSSGPFVALAYGAGSRASTPGAADRVNHKGSEFTSTSNEQIGADAHERWESDGGPQGRQQNYQAAPRQGIGPIGISVEVAPGSGRLRARCCRPGPALAAPSVCSRKSRNWASGSAALERSQAQKS